MGTLYTCLGLISRDLTMKEEISYQNAERKYPPMTRWERIMTVLKFYLSFNFNSPESQLRAYIDRGKRREIEEFEFEHFSIPEKIGDKEEHEERRSEELTDDESLNDDRTIDEELQSINSKNAEKGEVSGKKNGKQQENQNASLFSELEMKSFS